MGHSEKKLSLFAAVLLAIYIALAGSAFGQGSSRGTITGIVIDTSGAVVPGAAAVLTNTGTNVTWQTKSDSAGVYLFSNLPVGTYGLKLSAPGFSAVEVPALRLR